MVIKKKINLLNIIGYALLGLQALSFIGSLGMEKEPITGTPELLGYYVGSNFFLIIAIILFLSARSLRKKLNKANQLKEIDSIGQDI